MKILLIKTSSLGDVFHTLPALEDARSCVPGLQVDWVVEEAFKAIPAWHPVVNQVIPVAWRRWRKNVLSKQNRTEMREFRQRIQAEQYDMVLDAQGLVKSALMARLARGTRVGLCRNSCREPVAANFYQKHIAVPKGEHAIHRLRRLFALALDYEVPEVFSYGVTRSRWKAPESELPYWLFLHGTTWDTKLWPEAYWRQLAQQVIASGRQVVLPWGNEEEHQRAIRIAAELGGVRVLPRLSLDELTAWLAHAQAIVGVDTGLSHVAAALEVPAVAIYGATDAVLTGALGPEMTVLSSSLECAPCLSRTCQRPEPGDIQPPCYRSIDPDRVFSEVCQRLNAGSSVSDQA